MKAERSNFAGVPGLIFLALLFAAASWFQLKTAQGVILALFFVFLAAFFWSKHALDRIETSIADSGANAFPGETFRIDVSITNRKFLPLLWLTAGLPLPERSCICSEDRGEALEASFRRIMPHQSISFTLKAHAVRRGVCDIAHINLRSGDGFGLSVSEKKVRLAAPVRFTVFPEVFPVDTVPLTRRLSELENDRRGLYTDPTLISSIRDYRDGDSFRDINWRMLARSDRLMTNVRERLSMRRLCLIPDLESYSVTVREKNGNETVERLTVDRDRFEAMLSMTASLAAALSEKGALCSIIIPAYGDVPENAVIPENARDAVPELLTALAEITYDGGPTDLSCGIFDGHEHLTGQPFVLFDSTPCPAVMRFTAGIDRRPAWITLAEDLPGGTENGPVFDAETITGKELAS